ncbi:hypothetical protein THTE_4441 [Thermogutta terrifontis]|uniref:Uncharacterized protein n=1 Tax=Thermogutta terrifontis TaxID=1331910 RepID=A0A286RM59_9BACT|nr:hypothetical protein THTE_4441 [Thermogutta terrifontis]
MGLKPFEGNWKQITKISLNRTKLGLKPHDALERQFASLFVLIEPSWD